MISAGFKVAVCAGFVPFSISFMAKNVALFEDKDFHLKYGAFFTNVEKLFSIANVLFPGWELYEFACATFLQSNC